MKINSNSANNYQFKSCLRPYLLACSMIRYAKTVKKALPGVSVSCRHKRCSEKDTINSVAACARKQGAVATFDGQKWPDKCRKHSQQVKPQKSQLQRIAANDTLTGSVA